MQKILIVEDDRDIAANIADYLQGGGSDVVRRRKARGV